MIISPHDRMIAEAPENREPSHIRPIGPHRHDWQLVGRDGAGETYQQCRHCGSRRVQSGRIATASCQAWLKGGPWNGTAEPAEKPSGEAFAFSKRRGRPPGSVKRA